MIDLNSYKLALEKKWGLFKKKDHYFSQGDMPFVSKVAKLNVFFQPLSDEQIAYISSIFNISLPEDLVNFWRQTNGCRLFFGSLNVLGLQMYPKDLFEPYDLRNTNAFLISNVQNSNCYANNYFYFACLGGEYYFAYKKNEMKKIYCIKKDLSTIEAVYNDFDSWFKHFFEGLIDEYSSDCRKIHINPEDADIPVLAHVSDILF